MPIVASMGGVAATQTLTIVLRGLTLEQINASNLNWLFKRELAVSILNGFVLSILVGLATFIWFEEIILSFLISQVIDILGFQHKMFSSMNPHPSQISLQNPNQQF